MTCELATGDRARELDDADSLSGFRSRFYVDPERIYLDGNSLGLLSRDAENSVLRVLEEWKSRAIDGWTEGESPWFGLAEELGAVMASLVGAHSDEVIVANSTTVNLHQALATLYRPSGRRTKILTDGISFPSDLYAIDSHLALRGLGPDAHVVVPARGRLLEEDDLIAAMTDEVAVALFPAVVYTTGQLLDVKRLADLARERGVTIGFDCSHAVGAVELLLHEWQVDFGVWCSYKYLNGGPGGSGALFLHRGHHGVPTGLAGWFSSDKSRQFDMAPRLSPGQDAGALQIGTPNILSMAPLCGALKMVRDAGIAQIRIKSLAQTRYLMDLIRESLEEHGFRFANPIEDHRRGGHVALIHPEALRICRALKSAGVVPDFRPPDIIRLAPSPLYTTFGECRQAVVRLKEIMDSKSHLACDSAPGLVT